ncbi:isoprenyl transferase [bacterium]|nr:isoprenyl transferase [bacterium]
MKKELDALAEEARSIKNLPVHIAIIMDGNGRWAKRHNLPRTEGHKEGVKTVKRIVRFAGKIGLKYLTLYTFSKENWRRPRYEVKELMRLLRESALKEAAELEKNNVRLLVIGNIEGLPLAQRKALLYTINRLKNNTGLTLILALNYSGREEILEAAKKLASENTENIRKIDTEQFKKYLYTKDIPDPDLIIRTSGEMRLSNFLLYQGAYSELFFTPTLWPDFTEEELLQAIRSYSRRQRRFGMTEEQITGE